MKQHDDFTALAGQYHLNLPDRIRDYLNGRGIPDAVIGRHLLGWSGWRITIPIPDRDRLVRSFKLAKDPVDDSPTPKMIATPGARLELYGWEELLARPDEIIICEGEFDRLVLEAQGFHAVTSTGGARSFRPEWAEAFEGLPAIFVCFDRDEAGARGTQRVARFLPKARIIDLPAAVGEGGDVTDFFVRLGSSQEDFRGLMSQARPLSDLPPVPLDELPRPAPGLLDPRLRERLDRLKAALPIEALISRYVILQRVGSHIVGLCPFHDDRSPSLAVYPRSQSYYCFGCGRSGDVVSFVRDREHLSFRQALERLEQPLRDNEHNDAKAA